jgi:hypothetical protein
MKILFLLGAASRIRNFDHTIVALAERGHDVRVAGRLRKGSFELPPSVAHPRVSARVNPTERTDEWRDFVDLLRGARDYVRYFDPRYAQATRLVRRAYEIAPTEFVLYCERHPWIKRRWHAASQALAFCEALIPTEPTFEAFLREERPDLVLVTPLVTFESYQTDYVKAAHRLGLPVAFIPFSWDNLTNKGLMRIHPDRVLVWNEVQRREAIELHGCAPDTVAVTGAARFDDFFAGTPATSRDEFCGQHGLDPARPLALYLGSSQLTGPNEMELIRRWVEALRRSTDEVVRDANILVRPHPALSESWASVDYSDLPRVAVSRHASRGADQDLFDSLFHAHVAVGLNTSAMLEAAIVGRPVHTLMVPGFDEGQTGTKHFWYLVEAFGGLATIATTLEEHCAQLATVLRQPQEASARSRAFAESFLRPHGIGRPVAPVLAAEVERAGAIRRQSSSPPAWHRPLRWALHRSLSRRRQTRRAVEDTSVVGTQMSLRPVRTALEELQHGSAPIFVGPWFDSVTHELLYWIPFVRWASATYGLAPERLVAISRGGVQGWYGALARRYLDAPTLFSSQELEHWARRSAPQSEQNPKTAVMAPFDTDAIERAARAFDLSDYQVLHPLALYRVLMRLRKDRAFPQMPSVLHYAPIDAESRPSPMSLPKSFVAISLACTEALPDTAENRDFLAGLLAQLIHEHEVVVVDEAPVRHVSMSSSRRLHALEEYRVDGDTVLQAQATVLGQAQAFVGGYGDLAVLASFCRTTVRAYHSEKLPSDQPDRLLDAATRGGWGAVSVERARRTKSVRLPERVNA